VSWWYRFVKNTPIRDNAEIKGRQWVWDILEPYAETPTKDKIELEQNFYSYLTEYDMTYMTDKYHDVSFMSYGFNHKAKHEQDDNNPDCTHFERAGTFQVTVLGNIKGTSLAHQTHWH